jgi:DNA-directed RNA polymerase specialized sigma24 family protein
VAHSASEIFTVQLARAAGKTARRFLAARGLQGADRDDVVAAAVLWCWENRNSYSLTTTLETWFMNAVRDAYKKMRRGELPLAGDSIEELGGGDETYNVAEAESAAEALVSSLTAEHRRVAALTMRGHTRAELVSRGISKRTIDEARSHIRNLRHLLPEEDALRHIARRAAPVPSDEADDRISGIDLEIEQLEFAPPAGKECPPCWRCLYFEGYLPADTRSTRMEIADGEVRAAVKDTETRKIEIARQVRK